MELLELQIPNYNYHDRCCQLHCISLAWTKFAFKILYLRSTLFPEVFFFSPSIHGPTNAIEKNFSFVVKHWQVVLSPYFLASSCVN